ncbi:type IV toxin-antitoxin system AbiEi family antitoxin domain-containing protein [Acrocarpospora catenulata]|uniref:type IV toxin-antitoxin system AbiEi family antitoxin domain-containing protein n=1 Tax=Acrocarpospora catenulata TaxID=2836182 RepID=UPI001BD93908|nr:type IV toxin-antitoxin system AbiEi family antitoxin domain-containing protein [Acrocarpospora catenulata]
MAISSVCVTRMAHADTFNELAAAIIHWPTPMAAVDGLIAAAPIAMTRRPAEQRTRCIDDLFDIYQRDHAPLEGVHAQLHDHTARLLTTPVLHQAGYGLKGIYSLDEHYARDLSAYYAALTVDPSHNYYLGRAEADITGFVDFFCVSMADALGAVRARAAEAQAGGVVSGRDDSAVLRRLDPRARRLLELFRDHGIVTGAQVASHLGLSPRTVAPLARRWVQDGLLEIHDSARKTRSYRLSPRYERLIC